MSNNKKNYTYLSFLMSQLQFSLADNPENMMKLDKTDDWDEFPNY